MTFNETQLKTLRAALDRLIPPDDYPGAWDAGVGDYILRQLDGDLTSLQSAYTEGLDALNAEARALEDLPFPSLEPDAQDNLLRRLEGGVTLTAWPVPPERFVSMLIHHAAEGYYADPGNGGNREARSWEMIGFKIEEGVRYVG
ncbi:MAG TPA: gluconate 2-dehydrogenase subunit 3 family protein [Chthonomonadaceae bacterium]|nr:gluconate 2-dehydrogenase subunit 3 family protein [Chthonomonadaceae bacterium]